MSWFSCVIGWFGVFDEGLAGLVVDVMRLLYRRGLVQVRGGNASVVDRSSGLVYMSPTGVPRHLISVGDVSVVSLDGRVLRGSPTSEWRMHLAVYTSNPSSVAVVHAHPPSLLALHYRGCLPDPEYLTEVKLNAECIRLVPYRPPGSVELALEVGRVIRESGCNALILERHGALVFSSKSIYHALDLLEALEDLSRIMLLSGKC